MNKIKQYIFEALKFLFTSVVFYLLIVAFLNIFFLIIDFALQFFVIENSLTVFIDKFLASSCHQNPGRSFIWFDKVFSLCCRCNGIYFGTLLMYFFLKPKSFKLSILIVSTFLLIFPILEKFLVAEDLFYTNRYLLFIMGLISGFGVMLFFLEIKLYFSRLLTDTKTEE